MKIIGYQSKGNAIRLYLGAEDVNPKYQKNNVVFTSKGDNVYTVKAEIYNNSAPGLYPFIEFITGWKDIYVSLEKTAFTNSNIELKDYKSHNEPLIVIADSAMGNCDSGFMKFKGGRDVQKFYLDDTIDPDQIGVPTDYPGKSLVE
jgi:hypothetical protein